MRVSGRLSAVALFAGVSLLALVVSGLLDWISSSLFLLLECLVQGMRRLFGRPHHRPAETHLKLSRRLPRGSRFLKSRAVSGKFARRKIRPSFAGSNLQQGAESIEGSGRRVLVVLRGDEPELVAFAMEECRCRKAELLLLLLRPLAVIPMGPSPPPGFAEDAEANTLFEEAASDAQSLAVRLKTFYEVTSDPAKAILNRANEHKADLVIVSSKRRGPLTRVFAGDIASAILPRLPKHASLMVKAT